MSTEQKDKINYYIVAAVFIQPVLVLIQALLIDIFNMDPEATTIYRVILSAISMSFAIIFSFKKRPAMFLITYSITISILLINIVLYPKNASYIETESIRFLIPIVISSALCLIAVNDIFLIEKVWYHISWIVFIEIIIYSISYFRGIFVIDEYNMAFSYGALLPMVAFYRKKNKLNILVSIIIFVIVLAIGSRGAVFVFLAYVLYDISQNKIKLIIPIIIISIFLIGLIPVLISYFESIGINSRTLNLLISDQIMQSSGRDDIYNISINAILDHPFFGIGLWGDRVLLKGSYCHNIIIELFLNWGVLLGSIIIISFLIKTIQQYYKSDKQNRNRIICYSIIFLGPLMVSGSYLTEANFGIFVGLIYVLYHKPDSVQH